MRRYFFLLLIPPLTALALQARGAMASAPAQPTPVRWGADVLRQKPEWYASREATAIADSVIQYQAADGGWPKNTDLGTPPASAESRAGATPDLTSSTIDNNGTTLPMQFLALVAHATGEMRYRAAFTRGFDYLLAAQYPNGGWPQFFPLRQGYYSRITFNDNAMVNVLTVLRDAATGKAPYVFVDETGRAKARTAVSRGIDIILKTQVRQEGRLTAWCAQHDEKTLAPAWARAYEPPSLSGSESVGIVRFLMDVERPTPAVVAAIDGAIAWLTSVAIPALRFETFTGPDGRRDRRVVPDPSAGPLWARFYELGTNRPIFLGRDSVVRYALSEIEHERRNGYAYYGQWPATLLDADFPRWREKNVAPKGGRYENIMPLAPLVFSAKTVTSVEAHLVDAVIGRLAEEQLTLVVHGGPVGGAVARAHELPLLSGDQRLEEVLAGGPLRIGFDRLRPVAPQPAQGVGKPRPNMPPARQKQAVNGFDRAHRLQHHTPVSPGADPS